MNLIAISDVRLITPIAIFVFILENVEADETRIGTDERVPVTMPHHIINASKAQSEMEYCMSCALLATSIRTVLQTVVSFITLSLCVDSSERGAC